jgi:predicted TIM-barrel fold metal-dependent hydrolase
MDMISQVLNGRIPDSLKIFDAHAHIGEGEYSSTYLYTLPVHETIRLSRKIGIQKMAVSSLKAIGGDVQAGNKRLIELCEAYPSDLYAYVYYSPKFPEECLKFIDNYKSHPGFIGVKIHPREDNTFVTDKLYYKLYEFSVKNNLVILCHTWETEPVNDPALFENVLQDFPTLRLLIGHMGGTYRGCMSSIALANKYPNVYLDINGSLYSEIWIEKLIRTAPVNKFVFSTDQVFNDPRIIVGRVLLSNIDEEVKQRILCSNFEELTGRKLL